MCYTEGVLTEIFLAILAGMLLGTVTGLTPGIHINLLSVMVLSLAPLLLEWASPLHLAMVIGSMAITHTFLDAIPSIFLGAPDPEMVLSVLPGHRLLLKGQGYEAVMLTAIGSLFALVFSILLLPVVTLFAAGVYSWLQRVMGLILLFASLLLVVKEKQWAWALSFFLLAGLLGMAVLNLDPLREPLFPLLSGLFGTSLLLLSVRYKTKVPEQRVTSEIKFSSWMGCKGVLAAVPSGMLGAFLPGLGPSQAAILGSQGLHLSSRGFLVLVGGLNTAGMVLSFASLYAIGRPRNGAVIAISKLLPSFGLETLVVFIGMAAMVGGLATLLTSLAARAFLWALQRVNYPKLCIAISTFILVMVWVVSGWLGVGVLLVATAVGILPSLRGVGKNHLMGCLLLPIMLYFFFA